MNNHHGENDFMRYNLRFMKILYFLILLIFLFSCKEKKNLKKDKLIWNMLDIEVLDDSKTEKIAIFNYEDSCKYTITIKDENHFKKYGEYDHKIISFKLPIEKKNTLFNLFKELFNNNSESIKNEVSCYAGLNVSFTINRYSNPSYTCKYSSVSDWFEISKTTQNIYDLTIKKIHLENNLSNICTHH